jgi:hypothetical protein
VRPDGVGTVLAVAGPVLGGVGFVVGVLGVLDTGTAFPAPFLLGLLWTAAAAARAATR